MLLDPHPTTYLRPANYGFKHLDTGLCLFYFWFLTFWFCSFETEPCFSVALDDLVTTGLKLLAVLLLGPPKSLVLTQVSGTYVGDPISSVVSQIKNWAQSLERITKRSQWANTYDGASTPSWIHCRWDTMTASSAFCHHNKIPERIILRRERGLQFQSLWSMAGWTHWFLGTCKGRPSWWENRAEQNCFHPRPTRKRQWSSHDPTDTLRGTFRTHSGAHSQWVSPKDFSIGSTLNNFIILFRGTIFYHVSHRGYLRSELSKWPKETWSSWH